MVEKMSKTRAGLAVGLFAALIHLLWALIVMVMPNAAQSYLDFVFPLHFIGNVFSVIAFNFTNAIILVVMAFVGGYIFGWLFAVIWDWLVMRKVK